MRRSSNSRWPSFNPWTGKETVDFDRWAQEMAAHNLRKPSLDTLLRRWWVKKYKLPWTHELAQDALTEDLLVEYWEDYYEEHPHEAREHFTKGGELYFEPTGDELIDKWEEEWAKGVIPDLEEGLSPQERERLRQERARARAAKVAAGALGDVNEDYTKKPPPKPSQYDSKFVVPGSQEEMELLSKRLLGHGKSIPSIPDVWEDLLGR